MSFDRSWMFEQANLTVEIIQSQVQKVLASYSDITCDIEQEASDCITCFFRVSSELETKNVEISFYHMDGKRYVLSLEADAADNHGFEIADILAEDLAVLFDAEPLEE